MRLLVFSDAHGDTAGFYKMLSMHPEADEVVFLGDGEAEVLPCLNGCGKPFVNVRGNCDFGSRSPYLTVIEREGIRIGCTHGHLFHVKSTTEELMSFAAQRGIDLMLYGHTHVAHEEYRDGVRLLNPGSIARPASGCPGYGIVDITPGGIMAFAANLRGY